ncbi:MAG: hypothetical protein M1819_005006 [Sarea resinae]|nr:MAG: hypothetical protein M1819_005006 [Sarea resinae]
MSSKIAVYSLSGKPIRISFTASTPKKEADPSLRFSPDLKNTTDDALPNYLNSLTFTQSHLYTDVRLALGYAAVAIAGATFYFDYRLGFDATKSYTLWAVIAYFLLNTALTVWIWGVEKGKVFVGTSKDGVKVITISLSTALKANPRRKKRYEEVEFLEKESADNAIWQLTLESSTKKHVPVYHLTATYTPSSSRTKTQTIHLSAPFNTWFASDGTFIPKPFQQWLASSIPIIGVADPGNADPASVINDTAKTTYQNSSVNVEGRGQEELIKEAMESNIRVPSESDVGTSTGRSRKGDGRQRKGGKKAQGGR